MQTRIDKSKLLLLHHIKNLDDFSLNKQVYKEQSEHGWPGLVSECGELLKQWNLKDIFTEENSTRFQWTNIVKKSKSSKWGQIEKTYKEVFKLEVMKVESYREKLYRSEMKMEDARVNLFKM